MKMSRSLDAAWLVCWAALLVLAPGCRTDKGESMTSFSSTASKGATPELFSIPAAQLARVQLVTLQPSRLERTLRLSGNVAYNAFKTTPVITQIGGIVTRILALPGESVREGQALLTVSSPDYAQQRGAYLKARDTFRVTDKNYARAQDLYSHGAIAERDLLQAESDRNQAQADLDTTEQALKILGLSNPEELLKAPSSPEVPVPSPLAGEVVERLVAPGQLLQGGATQVFTISDTTSVWILANLYETDLAHVHPSDEVTVQTDSYPDTFRGRISYISPALDPTTRTLQARIAVDNPRKLLKRDMYCVATVNAGIIENAITVPDSAVLRDDENEPFAYVVTGGNQFARRRIRVGQSQKGQTQVLSGLQAGEKVLGDGSLFVQFANSLQR
jgi:cobalt-zinc-cadmium efflux system membrane fusion protein